ncbi:MAG: hypothetical protein R2709_10800 [Marmoricola sp.]
MAEDAAGRIILTLQDDGGIRVEDNGRGIPTGMHPTENMPALTMALTMLHAGGKFGGGGYRSLAACMASASRWSTPCQRHSR